MRHVYKTSGTCSSEISFDMDQNGVVKNVSFKNGCDGNLKAIARLVEGMSAGEIIEKCAGITCEQSPTSCGDQLARALERAMKEALPKKQG